MQVKVSLSYEGSKRLKISLRIFLNREMLFIYHKARVHYWPYLNNLFFFYKRTL